MNKTKTIAALISLWLFCFKAMATHIAAGTMTYTYLNSGVGFKNYKVRLLLYRDVSSSTPLEDTVRAAIHRDDAGNALIALLALMPVKKELVRLGPEQSCTMLQNLKFELGVYEAQVQMPDTSASGYIITWLRCCRNRGQVNIPEDYGVMFSVNVPGPTVQNSSPYFVNDPVRVICSQQLADVLNNASDPDGDSLVYELVQPYTGGSSANPMPYSNGGPPMVLPYPFPLVQYHNTFSANSPFGPGGQASISASSGVCRFKPASTGMYSLAVEVKEYRNGAYLGAVRLDMILLALNCPSNTAPVLLSQSGALTQTVEAGQTFCFPVHFENIGDSIFLTVQGDIVDSSGGYAGPRATAAEVSNYQNASTLFCWTPLQSAVRAKPYQVYFKARNNGCPPSSTVVKYEINVTVPVGSRDMALSKAELFPNPVHEQLTIRTGMKNDVLHIRMYNNTGVCVSDRFLAPDADHTFQLPVHTFPAGLYLLQVQEAGQWQGQRVLVMH